MCDSNNMARLNLAELVKSLRICGDWRQQVRVRGSDRCEGCKYRIDGDCKSFKGDKELLLNEAADAIEELQKNRVCRIVEKDGETELFIENRWISVKERLPEEKAPCIVYNKDYGPMVGWRVDGERFRIPGSRFPDHPTHWMPLPQPPKEETE